MSKKGAEDKGGTVLKPVALPSLPKFDDHNRDRWAQEYDKVEQELLKSHIQAPNTITTTLGLRLLPSQWDRTIPAGEMDSPTRRKRNVFGRAATTEPGRYTSMSSVLPGGISPPLSVRPVSARSPVNVTTSLSTTLLPQSLSDTVRLLLNLLNPPVQFRTSFRLDLTGIDLHWVLKYNTGDRTPTLYTLETVRDDMITNPSAGHDCAINSPRSGIVLLRNGVTVEDLQALPLHHFFKPDVAEEMARVEHKHHEQRRKDLLISLREEYRNLCEDLTLMDLLDNAVIMRTGAVQAEESTMIRKQKEKQKSVQQINQEKLKLQVDYATEIQTRIADAEHKRQMHDREIEGKRREEKMKAEKAAEATMQRMIKLREETAKRTMEFLDKAENRRRELEEKEALRNSKLTQKLKEKKEESERKLMEKNERIEANKKKLEDNQKQAQVAYEESQQRAIERKEKLDREREERKGQVLQKQSHAQELKQKAVQKAKDLEIEKEQKAEEKRSHAHEQLQRHLKRKEEERQQERQREMEREQQRQQAKQKAKEDEEERRKEIVRKMQEHENIEARNSLERQASILQHREVEKMTQDDKHFFVQRQNRAMEFQKLMSVSSITKKREKADNISIQRQKLLEATLHEREVARLERERAEKEIADRMKALDHSKSEVK